MSLYELPLSMALLGIGMGTMLANFHMCDIMLLLRAILNRGPMCFRFLMLVCQEHVSCYFYFVLLPPGPELW